MRSMNLADVPERRHRGAHLSYFGCNRLQGSRNGCSVGLGNRRSVNESWEESCAQHKLLQGQNRKHFFFFQKKDFTKD